MSEIFSRPIFFFFRFLVIDGTIIFIVILAHIGPIFGGMSAGRLSILSNAYICRSTTPKLDWYLIWSNFINYSLPLPHLLLIPLYLNLYSLLQTIRNR